MYFEITQCEDWSVSVTIDSARLTLMQIKGHAVSNAATWIEQLQSLKKWRLISIDFHLQ